MKRKNIKTFNPYYLDPEILGIVIKNKNVIFTNIFIFINRIALFINNYN